MRCDCRKLLVVVTIGWSCRVDAFSSTVSRTTPLFASGPPRCVNIPPSAFRCSPPRLDGDGHVFVVHGDVLTLSSDALLVPTRNLNNRKWFPHGPPAGAAQPPREMFTPARRVMRVIGGSVDAGRAVWLGHLDGRFAPYDRRHAGDAPELAWFLEAAGQFLRRSHADLLRRGTPPRCGRAKHVLAMPVVGTGYGGARGSSGEMIANLLQVRSPPIRTLHTYAPPRALIQKWVR